MPGQARPSLWSSSEEGCEHGKAEQRQEHRSSACQQAEAKPPTKLRAVTGTQALKVVNLGVRQDMCHVTLSRFEREHWRVSQSPTPEMLAGDADQRTDSSKGPGRGLRFAPITP